jgi:hypothetical protein
MGSSIRLAIVMDIVGIRDDVRNYAASLQT